MSNDETRAMPEAVIQAAWEAAFPGLPVGIGYEESKRRATNAAQVAWAAALASVPVPLTAGDASHHTELIEQARWLASNVGTASGGFGAVLVRLADALESQQGNTTQEWAVLAPIDKNRPLVTDEETARVIAANNPEFYTLAHRTPAGPWILVAREQS